MELDTVVLNRSKLIARVIFLAPFPGHVRQHGARRGKSLAKKGVEVKVGVRELEGRFQQKHGGKKEGGLN